MESHGVLILVIFLIMIIGVVRKDIVIFASGLVAYFAYRQFVVLPAIKTTLPKDAGNSKKKMKFTARPEPPADPIFADGVSVSTKPKDYILSDTAEIITMKQAPPPDPVIKDNSNIMFRTEVSRQKMARNAFNGIGRIPYSYFSDFIMEDPPWTNIALDRRTIGRTPLRTG